MKEYKRLGVYLDEWPDDKDVLAYTARIAALAESEAIHCVCYARHEDEHDGAREDHEAWIRERLPESLHGLLAVQVVKDHPVEAMMQMARAESLDLVLAGRSLPSSQLAVGNAFNRIARKAPCTVLLVPEDAKVHLARALVPVDFSEHSKLAIEAAIDFARASEESNPQVIVQTVYRVGYGYRKMGITLEEASKQLHQVNLERLQQFVAGIDTAGVEFELECTCSENPAAAVHEFADVRNMDLICVGSRGVTSAALALLGGTAEQVVVGASAPVLVVKRKGETAHFLDALFGTG